MLISINWLVYIWATNNEHVVEASLGYYINPLIIIGFGVIFLKEKMRPLQWAAVTIASIGVLVLTFDYGRLPWIALALAVSWGSYGLIKKQLGLGALEGLAIETLISSIFYLAYLIYIGNQGTGQFGHGWVQLAFRSPHLHHPRGKAAAQNQRLAPRRSRTGRAQRPVHHRAIHPRRPRDTAQACRPNLTSLPPKLN